MARLQGNFSNLDTTKLKKKLDNWVSGFTICLAGVRQAQLWRGLAFVKYFDIIHWAYNTGSVWLRTRYDKIFKYFVCGLLWTLPFPGIRRTHSSALSFLHRIDLLVALFQIVAMFSRLGKLWLSKRVMSPTETTVGSIMTWVNVFVPLPVLPRVCIMWRCPPKHYLFKGWRT